MYDNEDSVCGIIYNSTPYYFLKNQQGDIIAITNQNGGTIARYSYDAWGVCTVTQDSSGCSIAAINPFRYRGYYYDAEIGVYYLQSRYYNPGVGRFVNADEVRMIDSMDLSNNLFAYCHNDPIFNTDPMGYEAVSISISAILSGLKVIIGCGIVILATYLIIKILSNPSVRRDISRAISAVGRKIKAIFESVCQAILTAYVKARTARTVNKYEVHHIVAQGASRAKPARTVLKTNYVKIDIQSPINKVRIKYNLHRRLHTNFYYDSVNLAVLTAYANGSSIHLAKFRVILVLTAIRSILLKLNTTTP